MNSCNPALRKMGLLFLHQIFWWLIHDFFTWQMAVRSKNAMKCTLYFVRKCYLLEQNRNISGVSTSKLVRNGNGVHSANMFTNWTPQEDRTGYLHLYWFNLLSCDVCIYYKCVCLLLNLGPTVLEVFNTLLRHLRLSVDYELTGSYDLH